jgi:DNA-binding NarL/FixJ family response regulator
MRGARRRVLLIGGDFGMITILREYFHHGHDAEIEAVEYCDDALALLLRRPFDLALVLSLRAPWKTWPTLSLPAWRIGSESAILFLKQVRALHNPVPVLVASGWLSADLEKETRANGALAFLPKPIILAELGRVVARAFAGDAQGHPSE